MKNLNKATIIIAIATLITGFGLGGLIFGGGSSDEHIHESSKVAENQTWTCSMHPQIRQNEPGKCPICGMDLIPVESATAEDNELEVKMSQTAMRLANIQTSVVSVQTPVKEVRLTGKVVPDERNVYSQTSHISGRVEKLLVNYTGEYVARGEVIAYIYSPDLVTTQKELFEAYKISATQPALYNAAREKLKNWKLTDIQIDEIIEFGKPKEQFPILSDLNGIVISKQVNLGDYIKQGSSLFEVADLSRLWVLFDIHESEMPWIKVGDEVTFTIESIPGETFSGKISFIDPLINPNTRVAQARVVVSNSRRKLKPEMFASGTVKSPVNKNEPSIIVPKSAVMWTGERSVVYIKSTDPGGISFQMREVVLGPSLGDTYMIKGGLSEGEEIATHGTFSIDAAAQLAGKPSMMSPDITAGSSSVEMKMTGYDHAGSGEAMQVAQINSEEPISINKRAQELLVNAIEVYLQAKDALVNDNFNEAMKSGKNLDKVFYSNDMNLFKGEAHAIWMTHGMAAGKAASNFAGAEDIESARAVFKTLSNHMIQLVKAFNPLEKTLFIQHCPMADDFQGADWLSLDENILNPYYGASMLTCGEVTEEIN